jgi:hypothetical protein
MNKFISIVAVLITCLSTNVLANEDIVDYDKFFQEYYKAKVKTQQPNASKEDLEHYLSLLIDSLYR